MEKSLLIVDDDPDILDWFCEAIPEINKYYKCFKSSDAEEALENLKQKKIKPHYIFLDLNMPRMSGQDWLKEIKKVPYLSNIPVIIFTTSRSDKEIQQAYSLGAYSFLQKPYTTADLIKAVKKIIEA
jgi:CheY-like chemotaxis protein